MSPQERQLILEALLFATDVPLTFGRIKELVGDITADEFAQDLETLDQFYHANGRAYGLHRVAGGVQLATKPEFASWVRRLLKDRLKTRLSRSALETLAIIAYRQPIARAEMEHIRGVDCEGVLGTLMERGLTTVGGRATTPGRPLQYVTTQDFLRYFGLNELEDLPRLKELQGLIEGDPNQVQMAFGEPQVAPALPLAPTSVEDQVTPEPEVPPGSQEVEDQAAPEPNEPPTGQEVEDQAASPSDEPPAGQ
jgi:segregation and condensation protein B